MPLSKKFPRRNFQLHILSKKSFSEKLNYLEQEKLMIYSLGSCFYFSLPIASLGLYE